MWLNIVYVIYALAQAILIARYVFQAKEEDGPVMWVVIMALLAPLTSIALAVFGFYTAVTWLVTYKSKDTEAK